MVKVPKALAAPEPTGPITPEEWFSDMRRIGWTAVAGDFRGQPLGVIERGPRTAEGHIDWEGWRKAEPARWRLAERVHQSGADFWKRTSRYLFDLGLRETVGPAHV